MILVPVVPLAYALIMLAILTAYYVATSELVRLLRAEIERRDAEDNEDVQEDWEEFEREESWDGLNDTNERYDGE